MGPTTETESRPVRARALAVLAVLAVALAGVVSRPAHAAARVDMTVKNYSYSRPDLVIDPGTEVVWTAIEGDHTVTSDGGSFDGLIAQDYNPHSFSYTFTEPGRYAYHCDFHRFKGKGMTGVVEVRDPSGGPTTTEPPTTSSTWAPPTTATTAAPTTTTTTPPVTATTAAPTATTSPPVPTSTAPATAPANTPAPTPPVAPPAAPRPGQAGTAKSSVAAPVSAPTPAVAPTAAVAPTTTSPPPGDLAPAADTAASPDSPAVAFAAPAVRRQAGATTPSRSGAGDGNGPALGLLLGAGGLVALAGGSIAMWRRRH